MRFDLVDLRLFRAIAESGSITAGAERAALSLAAASERVRAMEETLGAPLLLRQRRGVRPTPAGEALLHHARLILDQAERMRGELADHAGGLRGHVRLRANSAAVTEFLPARLAAFLAANPRIDVDLAEAPSHVIVEDVAHGRAELGIPADWADPGALETHPFATDQLVLIAPRGHALAQQRRIAFAAVLDHEFCGFPEGSALQAHLAGHAARAGRALRIRVRFPTAEGIAGMVAAGVGVAVLSESAARRARRQHLIAILPLTDPWALRRLSLCLRGFDALPAHAQKLARHLGARA